MTQELSRSARRVQEVLSALGIESQVVELPATTRTAADAAAVIGCSVEQIAQSLVFRTVSGKQPVTVIASGPNRVNEARIAELIGEPIEKADAAYVREKTGFSIGGVPPVGHPEPIRTIVDADLLKLGEIWAAAGTPNSVVKLSSARLLEMTGGTATSTVEPVAQGSRVTLSLRFSGVLGPLVARLTRRLNDATWRPHPTRWAAPADAGGAVSGTVRPVRFVSVECNPVCSR